MSESEQSGAGRREVAYRLFAAEFDDADFSYSESDEERAPNYVITPTGARVNRLFVVGVLTEVEQVSEDVLRARVVDPTGAFVLYAGQYQPDEQAFLDGARTPMFVAVTGKARTFQPDDSDQVFTSIRPESISEVDAETRDRWTVQTAEQTIERVGHMATARSLDARGDDLRATLAEYGVDDGLAAGIALAIDHYGTTGAYLSALRNLSLDAARLVADELDEVEGLSLSPDQGDDAALPELADADIEVSVSAGDISDAAIEANASRASTDAGESEPTDTAESSAAGTASTESIQTETETSVAADETEETEAAAETTANEPTESAVDTSTEPTTDTVAESASTDTVETSTTESEAESTNPEVGFESSETDTVEAAATTPDGTEDDISESGQAGTAQSTATEDTVAESATDEDIGDFEPGEFELDEDEREEIEEEYGTEFQSGTDVPEPGESDIETPDPEELAEEAPDEGGSEEPEPSDAPEPTETADVEPVPADADEEAVEETESAADIDLEDVTVEVMAELDDGDGASRETLIETVVDRYGVGPGDVEDAIQDALMDGRCYEPDDTTVKPI